MHQLNLAILISAILSSYLPGCAGLQPSWSVSFLAISRQSGTFKSPGVSRICLTGGRGIKASQARAGLSRTNRLPITPSILEAHWDQQGPTQMLWAATSVCFLRSGEITVSSFDPKCHLTVSVDDLVATEGPPKVLENRQGGGRIRRKNGQPIVKAVLAVRSAQPGFLFLFTDGRLLTNIMFNAQLIDITSVCDSI